jgi:hypothetical protein
VAGLVQGELGYELMLTEQTRMKGSKATRGRKEREKEREEWAGQRLSAEKRLEKF